MPGILICSAAEVFIPFLHYQIFVRFKQRKYFAQLFGVKTIAPNQLAAGHPKFGFSVLRSYMYVRRLKTFVAEKMEPIPLNS
jgi:hypothetical protein